MGKKKGRKQVDDDWESEIQAEIEQMQNPGSSSAPQVKEEVKENTATNETKAEPVAGEQTDQPSNNNKKKGNGDNQKTAANKISSTSVETQGNSVEKSEN